MPSTKTKKKAAPKLSKEQVAAVNTLFEGMNSIELTLVAQRALARRKTVNEAARKVRQANEKARLEARLRKLSK